MTPIDVLTELPPPPRSETAAPTPPSRDEPQPKELTLKTAHVIAALVELGLVVWFLSLYLVDDPWRWQRDGERFIGVVVETQAYEDDGDDLVDWAILRDPQTELTVGFDPPYAVAQGDSIEVVRSPRDPIEVKTPVSIWAEYVMWVVLGVAAVAWPVLVWSLPLWAMRPARTIVFAPGAS